MSKITSSAVDPQVAAQVSQVGLRYSTDSEPGYTRRAHGKRFRYFDADGAVVRDAETIQRIDSLAIPPAYVDVWICASPRGHLQATGRDVRGRKQYRYHARWRSVRDRDKFARMVDFAQGLPALRRRLARDLKLPGLGRDKVLAMVVSVLAQTLIRVGNVEYALTNKSFGLTTLRKRHVEFSSAGRALFRFRGKGGLDHEVELDDARLTRLLRRCRQLPGQSLFQFTDDAGVRHDVDSGMVNEYLQSAMGAEFTAKDFRTWGGTSAAVIELAATPLPEKPTHHATTLNEVIKRVAAQLRNTPAVCRKSYIHPIALQAWSDGTLHKLVATPMSSGARKQEIEVLRFLRKRLGQRGSAAVARARRAGAG